MKCHIALFRGINVGGKNILPMKELVAELEKLGLHNVKTYIQSGNAIFQSQSGSAAQLTEKISKAINKSHGFAPQVLLLGADALDKAMRANPYPEAEAEPNSLHLAFLSSPPPKPDLAALEKIRAASEQFSLKGDVFYLHAPDGIGRSRLANGMERLLGVPMTSRNWRTVCKLREMARAG